MYHDYFTLIPPGQDGYHVCTRCTIDTTVPGAKFDRNGVCNFCELHTKLENQFPLNAAGEQKKEQWISEIKKNGKGKEFDCVLGVSGGRDSIYTLWLAVKEWGLRPLAVHFNDGFGNPTAGENMYKATAKLGVPLRTVTSDWRESKDIKISLLKAGVPDLEVGTDIGIATALYSMAVRNNVKSLIIGQSFRTEGIAPLSWNYLDGRYLSAIHSKFGAVPLRDWKPEDPGFRLGLRQMFHYTVWRRIRTYPLLYLTNYVRKEAEDIIKRELDWVYPGAHYFDDLFQSLMFWYHRTKFGFDRRTYNYAALVRDGQMQRDEALKQLETPYRIEDPKVIDLCIKRLGLSKQDFDELMKVPAMNFRDYPNQYSLIRKLRPAIWMLSRLNLIPSTAYDKYFCAGL
jgi:N-acetyl sugar amidotransferase